MFSPKIGYKKINTEHVRRGIKPQYARWNGEGKRFPKAGEYFISGCVGYEVAYLAKVDMTTEYFIAVEVTS